MPGDDGDRDGRDAPPSQRIPATPEAQRQAGAGPSQEPEQRAGPANAFIGTSSPWSNKRPNPCRCKLPGSPNFVTTGLGNECPRNEDLGQFYCDHNSNNIDNDNVTERSLWVPDLHHPNNTPQSKCVCYSPILQKGKQSLVNSPPPGRESWASNEAHEPVWLLLAREPTPVSQTLTSGQAMQTFYQEKRCISKSETEIVWSLCQNLHALLLE